jgi:ribose/xylose/arabinose/galactoside ABC-type transport system permease subunit
MTSRSIAMGEKAAQGAPREGRMRRLLERYGLLAMLIILIAVFSVASPDFARFDNAMTMLRIASISAIMFMGLTWVIASGEIDLTFSAIAALSGTLLARLVENGTGWPAASALALLSGVALGAMNGALVGLLGLPALITTIASSSFIGACAIILGQGRPIYITNPGFITELVNAQLAGVPLVAALTVFLYLGGWYAENRLIVGHYLRALPENREAAVQAGIPTRGILFWLFVFSGTTSAVAGLLLAGELNSGQPMIGGSFFLDGLTVVFLGAMVIKPGQPNSIGTAIGVIMLAVLSNGLTPLGWPNYAWQIIKGVLLLAGVSIVILTRRRT